LAASRALASQACASLIENNILFVLLRAKFSQI